MDVTSVENPLVKRLATLAAASGRRAEGLFLAEGSRLIDSLLTAGWVPAHLLVRADLPVPEHWPEVIRVSERVAGKLSQAATPSGYCAAFPIPRPAPLEPAAGGLILAGVADPGNVGTLIRSAAAFGIRQVVVSSGADPFGPKAVQATAGVTTAAGPVVARSGKRGAPPKYDWDEFYCELAVSMQIDGLPESQAAIVRRMMEWFAERNQYPDLSTVKKKVALLWRRYHEALARLPA